MSLSDRVEIFKNLMSTISDNNQPYFSKDYLVDSLKLSKVHIRKVKIKKIFNE